MPLSKELTKRLQAFYVLLQEYSTLDPQTLPAIDHLIGLIPSLVAIDDEELYAHWKDYKKQEKKWDQEVAPAYTAAKGKAFAPALEEAVQHIAIVIAAAQRYLQGYEKHKKDIVGAAMQKRFKEFAGYVQTQLDAPETGWLFLQQFLGQTQEFRQYTDQYNALQIPWKERIVPNANALLTDEKDVATTTQIVAIIQALRQFFKQAFPKLKESYPAWVKLANSETWEKRLEGIKIKYKRSQKRQEAELIEGNPAVAENKDYTYKAPSKKMKLYKKGKGDKEFIDANDVQQGDLDNCYVLSPLAALAQSNPSLIADMIEEQEDGSFEVLLHLRKSADNLEREKVVVRVKKEFLYNENGVAAYAKHGDQELWVQVIEKAYAQALGEYDGIAKGGDALETFAVLTGNNGVKEKIKDQNLEELQILFKEVVKNKRPLCISSMKMPNEAEYILVPDGQKIYNNHSYYLKNSSSKAINLQNPLGKEHLEISWKDLLDYFVEYIVL